MPNICNFEGRAKGQKKDVLELFKYLSSYYDSKANECKIYFDECFKRDDVVDYSIGYRIFSCYFDKKWLDTVKEDDNEVVATFYGDCAWSLYSCAFRGKHTYFETWKNNEKIITLADACKKLNVSVEIFTSETGCCFSEHYYIDENGEIVIDDETDYKINNYCEIKCDFVDDNGDFKYEKIDF